LPRLGAFILGTIVKERGWDVEVIVEQFHKIDFEKIRNADMAGVSTITPTASRAYAMAVYARNLNRLRQKQNKTFLKVMDLFRSKKGVKITIDCQTQVRLEDESAGMAM
jgi:hypothetical protein